MAHFVAQRIWFVVQRLFTCSMLRACNVVEPTRLLEFYHPLWFKSWLITCCIVVSSTVFLESILYRCSVQASAYSLSVFFHCCFRCLVTLQRFFVFFLSAFWVPYGGIWFLLCAVCQVLILVSRWLFFHWQAGTPQWLTFHRVSQMNSQRVRTVLSASFWIKLSLSCNIYFLPHCCWMLGFDWSEGAPLTESSTHQSVHYLRPLTCQVRGGARASRRRREAGYALGRSPIHRSNHSYPPSHLWTI